MQTDNCRRKSKLFSMLAKFVRNHLFNAFAKFPEKLTFLSP